MGKQYIYTIADLTKKHGQREVLSNIWLGLLSREPKLASWGRNGAGKSTLLAHHGWRGSRSLTEKHG